jgi:hypothetical protein
MHLEMAYARKTLGCILSGLCTDDSSESRAMRRQLRMASPELIYVECWSHQVWIFILNAEYVAERS